VIPNYCESNDHVDSSQTPEQALSGNPVSKCSIEAILKRSILAAHLLIGDITEAENVVMEAIDAWEPDDAAGEQLFQTTLRAAARRSIAFFSAGSNETAALNWELPIELLRVLKLPSELRQSFVLRVLLGLPSQVCTQILELAVHEVSEYTCAAMKRLSALDSNRLFVCTGAENMGAIRNPGDRKR
jgi:hypothetical protein